MNNTSIPSAQQTDDLLALFAVSQRGQGLADNTVRNRESIVRNLSRGVNRSLLEVDISDLRVHLGRPGIKTSSRRTERNALRAFFSFLKEEGIRDDDPAFRLATIRVPRNEPRPFAPEHIDLLLATGSYKRTRAMILLGYYQGFRVSSIAAVHGHDIDLVDGSIRTVGKGGKDRKLPLHPVIAELAKSMPTDSWWFPARRGKPGHIHARSVSDLLHSAKQRAGITDPQLTAHSLRHSFGSDLIERGVDVRIVQELMMHESLSTTQIYTRVSDRMKRDGIDALPPRDVLTRSGRQKTAAP